MRQQIVDAAERLFLTKGLARITTRDIALEAGCAEGTIFKYFPRKDDLLLATVCEKVPGFAATLREERAGNSTLCENLQEIALAALAFYRETLPLTAALFADPDLLGRYHLRLQECQGCGPQRAYHDLAAYLAAEQRLGRVAPDMDLVAASALLLGSCFQYAFLSSFMGSRLLECTDEEFVHGLVTSLLNGLTPGN